MNIALVLGLGCRWALAAVLTAAAVGKAFDPAGTRRAAAQLTLPGPMISAAGWLVPAVEGALALAIFGRELVDVCVKFHAARGRRAASA
jgi:hypothetical protein